MQTLAIAPQKLPLYLQISELITREIAAGHWHAGERLPAESDLAMRLNVAVGTLRKALSELQNRGLLERRQGSGTYVRSKLEKHGAQSAASHKSIYEFFRLELLAGGGLPSALILDVQCVSTPEHVPAFGMPIGFGKSAKSMCHRIRRLRLLNNLPIALEEIYFDKRHAPSLGLQDLNEALYEFYQQRFGFWISSVEDRIGLGQVPSWAADLQPALFGLAAGASCPHIERWSTSNAHQIEEYSTTWFDPSVARYVNRLR